jgi:predicted small lipoprotein YifL
LSRLDARPLFRLALVGVAVASLGLTACGRKGPLDPPPGASMANEPQANNPGLMNPITATPAPTGSSTLEIGPSGQPLAPKGVKKTIPLDVLLN